MLNKNILGIIVLGIGAAIFILGSNLIQHWMVIVK